MAKKNIVIFGTKFAKPKGLRLSPGVSSYNSCIRAELMGKTGGGRSGQTKRFIEAAKKCK